MNKNTLKNNTITSPEPGVFTDENRQSALDQALTRLEYPDDFKYPLDLATQITKDLKHLYDFIESDSTSTVFYRDLFHELQVFFIEEGRKYRKLSNKNNKAKENVFALCFATSSPEDAPVIMIFRAILLLDILSSKPALSTSIQKEIASQIKQSCYLNKNTVRKDLLASLSLKLDKKSIKFKKFSYIDFIEIVSQELDGNSDWGSDTQAKLLKKSLLNLLELSFDITQSTDNINSETRVNSDQLNSKYTSTRPTSTQKFDLDAIDEGKAVINTNVRQNKSFSSIDGSDDILDTIWSHEKNIDQITNNKIKNFPIQPEFKFEGDKESFEFLDNSDLADSVKTGRWIHNTVNMTPLCTARWNPIERKVFLKKLRVLSKSKNTNNKLISIAIYLMYITGEKLEQVVKWSSSNESKITQDTKFLIQEIPSPEKSYKPNSGIIDKFIPASKILKLPIPKEIQTLINKNLSSGQSLLAAHGGSKENIKNDVIETLKEWRDGKRFRLTFNRLTAALRTELMVKNNDPQTTFLLSRSELHASPTMHYYRATSHEELIKTWDACLNSLLGT